jgi:hypothetical protein
VICASFLWELVLWESVLWESVLGWDDGWGSQPEKSFSTIAHFETSIRNNQLAFDPLPLVGDHER